MATVAQSLRESPRALDWFLEFLKEELAPVSGRAGIVARTVLAATLVMIICETFRIPYAFEGAIYTLIISRASPRATLQSSGAALLFVGVGAAYVLISASFVISVPILHFLWVISSLFLAFYALSAITTYGAASTFALVIAVGIPIWERHVSAETNVEDTLWLTLAVSTGVVVTAVIELAVARVKPGEEILLPVVERLSAVATFLDCSAEGNPTDASKKKVVRFGMLGTSNLRHLLRRSNYSAQYRAEMSGVVALVGRLVDITATLTGLSFKPTDTDAEQLRILGTALAVIRSDLMNQRLPGAKHFDLDHVSSHIPLLNEMRNIVSLIPQAFSTSEPEKVHSPSSNDTSQLQLVTPDAFVNSEHLKFALRGCLAASGCYIIYNSIAWPSIGAPALATCLLTAVSAVGASRQRQILRFAAFIVGGLLIGIGSEILILPHVDSIGGFTVFFILIMTLVSWIMTSSPRLSYFGFQIAVIFCLINLQEFARQTSLAAARDRIVGVGLGLCMMWLAFDRLWSVPVAMEMKRAFISSLRLLAQLAREPASKDPKIYVARLNSLREMTNRSFDQVRALADALLFEFGPSRQRDLALRSRIVRWQPRLRMLFITRLALWRYRVEVRGFELPAPVATAQQAFDEGLSDVVDRMADRLEGKASARRGDFEDVVRHLEKQVLSCCSKGSQGPLSPELQTFLALSRSIENVTLSLDNEIDGATLHDSR
ncbi:MAG: FUSC family protein [Terracidiphilus sp.]